jgi:endonuclease VIII
VTAASTKVDGLPAAKLVGQRVEAVEAQGKHLLVRLDSGQVLHSHMKMTGSWHVYREGERWRRPAGQARLILACGDRVAVCFNAPVVELLARRAEALHPGLTGLGPDLLVDPFDIDEVRRRARSRPPDLAIGELLLDQRVVAGIGNIWRCESLFVEGRNPWQPHSALTDEELDRLVLTASRLMRSQLGPWQPEHGSHGVQARSRRWVYGRGGRPCRRCGTPIQTRRHGEGARVVYWCPRCQP